MKHQIIALTIMMLGLPGISFADKPRYPPIMSEIMEYFTKGKDYPEVINGKPYRIKAKGVVMADMDGDGREEVFLAVKPHYRQSPSIIIFTRNKRGKLIRVKEGLAPGPLVPVTGDYIDDHTLGVGVDMTIGPNKKGEPADPRDVAAIGMQQKMHVVVYKNFYHMSLREDEGGYIDMTHQKDFVNEKNCEKFEFAEVVSMKAGFLKNGGQRKYLVTVAGNELNFYRIDGVTKYGFLKKQRWAAPLPENFARLAGDKNGAVGYVLKNGKAHPLALPGT